MDAGAIVTIVVQSIALIFMAGVQWANLRSVEKRLTKLESLREEDSRSLAETREHVAALKRCRA